MRVLGSPFSVPVRELVDPSKVRCFGPGLDMGVRAHVPQTFTVDSSKAGLAPLVVQLFGPTGTTLKTQKEPNQDWRVTKGRALEEPGTLEPPGPGCVGAQVH